MTIRLGIDTGGTYTDAVLYDPDRGVLATAKALTTKHDLALGVGEAIAGVLADQEVEVAMVALSTTLATNALVEGHGSPVCLLLAGFEPEALDRSRLRQAMAGDPVVFLAGGHASGGDEQAPLDLAAARSAIETHGPKVAAFAVAGHFGVRNPDHELKLRDAVREATGLPVTCAHELTSKLDAPRRAMTTVLNGRLIPLLHQLILAVQRILAERAITAPLMVVKADGSLIAAEAALERPIETILSGPAASVIGAQALSAAEGDALISDMGGTTTDIALLKAGRPALSPEGAEVGGWRTMVEAVAVHTVGLGGDSEVSLDGEGRLTVGPRRALPLSLLAQEEPDALQTLRDQAAQTKLDEFAGRFARRLRPLDAAMTSLSSGERHVWDALAAGAVPLTTLLADHHLRNPLGRLIDRGLVITAAFTPSDAAHVLNLQDSWQREAATLGAQIWSRRLAAKRKQAPTQGAEDFCRKVFDLVVAAAGRALVGAALAEEAGPDMAPALGAGLLDRALDGLAPETGGRLIDVAVTLNRPLVALGAPAATYYPAIAARLATRSVVPKHAEVSNAVGAVASGVVQSVVAVITSPQEGRYRVHLPTGLREFNAKSPALSYAESEARKLARAAAEKAGAGAVELTCKTDEQEVEAAGGQTFFIEARVVATATGRPRLAVR